MALKYVYSVLNLSFPVSDHDRCIYTQNSWLPAWLSDKLEALHYPPAKKLYKLLCTCRFILRPPLITFRNWCVPYTAFYIISASLYTHLFCAMNNQAKLWISSISLNPYSCVLSLFSEPCSHNYSPVVDHLPYHVNDVMQCYLYDRQACEEIKFIESVHVCHCIVATVATVPSW